MEQFGINDIWTYLAGLLLIIIIPGPNSIYVLRTGCARGITAGYRAVAGVLTGDALLIFLAFSGVASAIKSTPALFAAVRFFGAFYLLYLGIKVLFNSFSSSQREYADKVNGENIFMKSLMLSVTNPKAIIFYVAFFIQFIDFSYPHPGFSYFILAIMLEICSFIYLTILIFFGTAVASFFVKRKSVQKAGDFIIGLFFVAFAIKIGTLTN